MENYQYIKTILNELHHKQIKEPEFLDELLDHYCTQYEALTQNHTASEALDSTITSIRQEEFTHNKTSNTMKKYLLHGLVASMTSLLIFLLPFTEQENLLSEITECEAASFTEVFDNVPQEPPYGMPLEVIDVTSGFGERMHPIKKVLKMHNGIDFKAKTGTKIVSVESGVVIEAGYSKKKGNYIEIQHDPIYTTRYFHLSKLNVSKSQKVSKGDKIGEVGSTGMSFNPHLHYEIIKSGKHVDPADYLRA